MLYSSGNNEINNPNQTGQEQSAVYSEMIVNKWIVCLTESKKKIEILKAHSEKEVLEIGTLLLGIHSSAKDITTQSYSYVSSLMGEAIKGKIDELLTIINSTSFSIEKSEKEVENSKVILNKINELLNSVVDSLLGFNRIVKHLRTLGISTKIEDSRLNIENTGFHVLAENVENLSNVIADKVSSTKRKATELSGSIIKVFSGNLELQNQQNNSTKNILGDTRQSLDVLTNNYGLCLDRAKIISNYTESLTGNVNEIVISIQFHDIIRQQLEHVEEAFDAVITEFNSIETENTNNGSDVLGAVFEIAKIQSAQLKHSRDEFYKACQEIILNLTNVNKIVAQVLDEIQTTQGIINNNNGSSLSILEHGIISMKDLLLKSYLSNNEFSSSIDSVIETVKDLTGFIYEVEEIGSEIEIIAMNSQIKAAHTGKEGVALGVIAEAIQKLSSDSKEQTVIVSSFLNQIVNIVSGLVKGSSNITKEDDNINKIISDLDNSSGSLTNLKRNIDEMTIKIKDMSETLQDGIDGCISGINIHNKMNTEVNVITSELDELIDSLARLGVHHNAKGSNRLNELEKKYTMQSERLIHDKISVKPADTINKIKTSGDETFDDNIELF